jgi:hypothetical protein
VSKSVESKPLLVFVLLNLDCRPYLFGGMSGAAPYQHTAIEGPLSIRLLVLHVGRGREPLRCSFRDHQLLDDKKIATLKPKQNSKGIKAYRAISYTWNDIDSQDQVDHIYCEDKAMQITKNLADLLLQF